MSIATFAAVLIICGIYVVCELVGKASNYKIPILVLFMLVLLVFGGQLGLIPADIFDTAGFSGLVYSFGLPFVLAGFGSTMSIKSLAGEGKTVVIAVIAVVFIMILGVIAGVTFMGMRTGIYGAIEIAGGGPAGLIFLTALQEQGDNQMIALMLCLMNMQILIGYPLCTFFMKKSMRLRIKEDRIPELPSSYGESVLKQDKQLIKVPAWMQTIYYDFAMLALACLIGKEISELTGIAQYVWYILIGFLFAELGLIKHNVLAENGTAGMFFSIMFVTVCAGFLGVKITDMGPVIVNLIIVFAFGILGCLLGAVVSSRIFKIDLYEAMAIGLGCMVGYPPSQKITVEAMQAFRQEVEISDDVALRLHAYYEPKIIISGIVTISMLTGILAGIVVSYI